LKEKLIKIGANVVSHGRYIVFQMAEVANPRSRDKTLFFLPPAIPVMANFECLIINQFPANDSPVARK
jgi:hypothetical protein